MDVLMLCGVFAKENEQEVIQHAKAAVEFSANLFQQKLIAGFHSTDCNLRVVSAPFIGSYPNTSSSIYFRGFSTPQDKYTYVPFNNIWGIRNISRTASLKKAVLPFVKLDSQEKLILVYAAHTPFLEAAVHAKKLDPRIRICLYVPDLPQYMNLNANRTLIYDIAKKWDVAKISRLLRHIDSFVLLTEQMKAVLPVGSKPCRVIEGIITQEDLTKSRAHAAAKRKETDTINVVYTGKLNERFGVKNLVDAFCMIGDPAYRLTLCGRGDCEAYINEKSQQDPRIHYLGQVSADEAREWMYKADVLVNPRQNNEEYTKYSFPSKTVEYLLSGNAVVAYKLDGMPDVYRDFLTIVEDDRLESLSAAITHAASGNPRYDQAMEYLENKCEAGHICTTILSMAGSSL